MRLVVICIPGSRRTALLREEFARWPHLRMVEVGWTDLLGGQADLRQIVGAGDLVRIDSPGKDFDTEVAMLRLGRCYIESGAAPSVRELDELKFERGRMLWPACWYAGFCGALRMVMAQLAECPAHRCTTSVPDVEVMFDKTLTHKRLRSAGVAVAPAIGRIQSFAQLADEAATRRWSQVFVKLAHGSSASGAAAIRFGRRRMVAMTTVEIENAGREKIFNTRRIRRLDRPAEIRAVVDALCPHGLHAERWLPKAGIDGRTFDLRILTIGGEVRHQVARLSQSPMTNLNLLNQRADVTAVRARCPQAVWQGVLSSCRETAAAFSRSHCLGIDVMIDNTWRRSVVLEVNAFGDLLPGLVNRGETSYGAQMSDLLGTKAAQAGLEAS